MTGKLRRARDLSLHPLSLMLTIIFHSQKRLSVSWMTAYASWTPAAFVFIFEKFKRWQCEMSDPFQPSSWRKNENDKLVPFQHKLSIFSSFLQKNKVRVILLKMFWVTWSTDFSQCSEWANMGPKIFVLANAAC